MSNVKSMSKQELLEYLAQSPTRSLMGVGFESRLGKIYLGYTLGNTNNTSTLDLNELPLDVLCDMALKFSEAIEAKRTAELEHQEAEQSELAEGLPDSHPHTSSREDFDAPETDAPSVTADVSTGCAYPNVGGLDFDPEMVSEVDHTEHDYAAYALYEREIRAALLSLEQAHMAGMSTSMCTSQHLLSLRCSLSEKVAQIRSYMETLVAVKS